MNGSTKTRAGQLGPPSRLGGAFARNWGPLFDNRLFRALWLANLASDFGYWMNSVGASWTMTDLSASPVLNTLIQACSTLPMFLLALPSGAMADAMDRPKLLYRVQSARAVFALAMAVLAVSSWLNPYTLLAAVFCLGVTNAIDLPASQAALSTVVDHDDIPVVASLNNLSFNLGRALGPALAGFLIGRAGAFPVFSLNAASAVGLALVYHRWHRDSATGAAPRAAVSILGHIREAFVHCLANPRFRGLLIRITVVYFCTNAFWCLFPIYSRTVLHVGSGGFGFLMGAIGAGAVGAALVLPDLKRRLPLDRLIVFASVLFAASQLAMTFASGIAAAVVVALGLGVSYAMIVSLFNATAQAMFPTENRARAISIYFVCFYGVLAASSSIWGEIAEARGMQGALRVSSGLLLVTTVCLFLWPARSEPR
jgi:predicted MFS family arabinose efflux permease